jgi:ElaB/YqjD/DUF883 family membrane-anchored ribosome-binding protein
MIIKNELLTIHQTLANLAIGDAANLTTRSPVVKCRAQAILNKTRAPLSSSEQAEMITRLKHAKNILKAADNFIGYQEEQHHPVSVMGVHASKGVYNTTIGIVLTLLVLSLEGFSSANIKYVNGWATYPMTVA